MIFYVKENNLFTSQVPVCDEGFREISKEEYESRIAAAKSNREQGTPADNTYDW